MSKIEKEEPSKKKKKGGAKNDEISVLAKFAENLNIKIFEDKYENTPE
jgi:hypothetical protein